MILYIYIYIIIIYKVYIFSFVPLLCCWFYTFFPMLLLSFFHSLSLSLILTASNQLCRCPPSFLSFDRTQLSVSATRNKLTLQALMWLDHLTLSLNKSKLIVLPNHNDRSEYFQFRLLWIISPCLKFDIRECLFFIYNVYRWSNLFRQPNVAHSLPYGALH